MNWPGMHGMFPDHCSLVPGERKKARFAGEGAPAYCPALTSAQTAATIVSISTAPGADRTCRPFVPFWGPEEPACLCPSVLGNRVSYS